MNLKDFRIEMNFRELGGYPTKDGRKVKHGMFYRSGALGCLNKAELDETGRLGIRSIFDFRSSRETENNPDPEIPGARYFHVSALTDEAGNEIDLSPKGMEVSDEIFYSLASNDLFLENFYGRLPFSPAYQVMFREIQHGQAPILIHCSAGKDRTGIGAALILLALNVDEDVILEDYMKTNEYRRKCIDAFLASKKDLIDAHPHAAYIMNGFEGVNAEALELALQKIKDRYQDCDTYFAQRYHLGPEELAYLREKYTED
ncbi:MAG: tyrosine-protein phosphatase [Solobacterium sp.]|jgi:protein-tyrosine phosphatase|nr:tyrosine-protein phosphatase [Solobacterium sp.]MCH4206628.1 tyrosine-protein phosphatase [Solobacterium sp.]MCH4228033.1 tyrosine-protein phosphatase [Solobacterium sp.]MCH4283468.1 tyrosine-protein phosphatase [Solobacterium sp.]